MAISTSSFSFASKEVGDSDSVASPLVDELAKGASNIDDDASLDVSWAGVGNEGSVTAVATDGEDKPFGDPFAAIGLSF